MTFVLAPVATMLFASGASWMPRVLPDVVLQVINMDLVQSLGMLAAPVLGALGAGFCLTRLHAKPRTTLGMVVCTVAFGAGLLVVYAAIAFVGCLIAIS